MMPLPQYNGILFIGDPHVASFAPGHRKDDYVETVLAKLAFAMETARRRNLLPIILGDLFHVPRNNPNWLLVALIEILGHMQPWVLLGNHDKFEARYSSDLSISVLEASKAIKLIKDAGTVAQLPIGTAKILIGASPDWTSLPEKVDPQGSDLVLWLTHHNIDFEAPSSFIQQSKDNNWIIPYEITGVDYVINGHIHTPKTPVRVGVTLWINPGSLVRIIRSERAKTAKPSLTIFNPSKEADNRLETMEVPHRPFEEIFYPYTSDTPEEIWGYDEPFFLKGLENLTMKRTAEGVGIREFLRSNLNMESEIDRFIWKLYEEVTANE